MFCGLAQFSLANADTEYGVALPSPIQIPSPTVNHLFHLGKSGHVICDLEPSWAVLSRLEPSHCLHLGKTETYAVTLFDFVCQKLFLSEIEIARLDRLLSTHFAFVGIWGYAQTCQADIQGSSWIRRWGPNYKGSCSLWKHPQRLPDSSQTCSNKYNTCYHELSLLCAACWRVQPMLSTRCCSHAWYASNLGFTGFNGFTSAFSAWATWAAWALVGQWSSLNVVVLASDSPSRIRSVWCPPLPSARPANCSRQSSQVGQGTAVRSLYDEVAETMAPLSDLLELGEVEDHMLNAYLGLTEFLQNMQHLICFMDFKDNCYENSEYMEVVQYFCHHLDNICHDLGLCEPEMNICGSLILDAGVDLGRVIQQIRASVLEQVQMHLGRHRYSMVQLFEDQTWQFLWASLGISRLWGSLGIFGVSLSFAEAFLNFSFILIPFAWQDRYGEAVRVHAGNSHQMFKTLHQGTMCLCQHRSL